MFIFKNHKIFDVLILNMVFQKSQKFLFISQMENIIIFQLLKKSLIQFVLRKIKNLIHLHYFTSFEYFLGFMVYQRISKRLLSIFVMKNNINPKHLSHFVLQLTFKFYFRGKIPLRFIIFYPFCFSVVYHFENFVRISFLVFFQKSLDLLGSFAI